MLNSKYLSVNTFMLILLVYLDLAWNRSLNRYLHQFNSDLLLNKSFGLQHFTYNNSAMLDLIFNHLADTNFIGLTVSYCFYDRLLTHLTYNYFLNF